LVVCERIARAVREARWPGLGSNRVTVSTGLVGSARALETTASDWLHAADQLLYRAKSEGRDRIITGETPGLRMAG
jgi:PleD family two-component response regulator